MSTSLFGPEQEPCKYDWYGRLLHGVHPPPDSAEYWAKENLKPWFPGVSTRLELVHRPQNRSRAHHVSVPSTSTSSREPAVDGVIP